MAGGADVFADQGSGRGFVQAEDRAGQVEEFVEFRAGWAADAADRSGWSCSLVCGREFRAGVLDVVLLVVGYLARVRLVLGGDVGDAGRGRRGAGAGDEDVEVDGSGESEWGDGGEDADGGVAEV
ncbi:hypothetical protein [Streptomyces sp. NBC_01476]|uniref:hypothetical protein n=1 Tax=Streptomyces sp. NBC_01476 TaxID=2903881 RepID=UPI002E330B13|nr:hypothetical protein [Streptomyces sp. NBC_01476]